MIPDPIIHRNPIIPIESIDIPSPLAFALNSKSANGAMSSVLTIAAYFADSPKEAVARFADEFDMYCCSGWKGRSGRTGDLYIYFTRLSKRQDRRHARIFTGVRMELVTEQ